MLYICRKYVLDFTCIVSVCESDIEEAIHLQCENSLETTKALIYIDSAFFSMGFTLILFIYFCWSSVSFNFCLFNPIQSYTIDYHFLFNQVKITYLCSFMNSILHAKPPCLVYL